MRNRQSEETFSRYRHLHQTLSIVTVRILSYWKDLLRYGINYSYRYSSLSILPILSISPTVHSRSWSIAGRFHVVLSETAHVLLWWLFICACGVPLDGHWVVTSRILRPLEPQVEFQICRSYHHFYLELGEVIPASLPTMLISNLELAFFDGPKIRLYHTQLLRSSLYLSVLSTLIGGSRIPCLNPRGREALS